MKKYLENTYVFINHILLAQRINRIFIFSYFVYKKRAQE